MRFTRYIREALYIARYLRAQTHTMGTRKEPPRRLDKKDIALNLHNARAERDYCAKLLRAGRRGLNSIQAHWFANSPSHS